MEGDERRAWRGQDGEMGCEVEVWVCMRWVPDGEVGDEHEMERVMG